MCVSMHIHVPVFVICLAGWFAVNIEFIHVYMCSKLCPKSVVKSCSCVRKRLLQRRTLSWMFSGEGSDLHSCHAGVFCSDISMTDCRPVQTPCMCAYNEPPPHPNHSVNWAHWNGWFHTGILSRRTAQGLWGDALPLSLSTTLELLGLWYAQWLLVLTLYAT